MNATGTFDEFRFDANFAVTRVRLGDLRRWGDDRFVMASVPPERLGAITHQITITTRPSPTEINENERLMERVYALLGLIGLRANLHVEQMFSELRYDLVDGSMFINPKLFENPLEGRLALELSPLNLVRLDSTLDNWTRNAFNGIKRKAYLPPALRYAVSRWSLSKSRTFREDALVDSFIALEALFLERNETPKNVMFDRMAQFAHEELNLRRSIVARRLAAAYQVRNAVVHGDVASPARLSGATVVTQEFLYRVLLGILTNRTIDIHHVALQMAYRKASKVRRVRPKRTVGPRRRL